MPVQNIDQLLQSALQHHQAGQFQQAEKLYRDVLQRVPNQPDALHLLGVLALSVGRADIAVDLTRKALANRPNWPDAAYNLGVALKAAGRLDEAIVAYQNAIRLRSNHPESHFNLAAILQEKGDKTAATAAYKKVIQLNPNVFEAHYQIGILLSATEAGDDSGRQATTAFQKAVALKPDHADAWIKLGTSLHRQKEPAEAIAAYRQAISLEPGNAHAHNNLGAVLREEELIDESISECKQAVALDPGFAEAHANLGSALKEARRFEEAEAAYQRAIALNPSRAEVLANLGGMLQEQRRTDQAIALLRQAVALNPQLAEAHSSLGNALRERGLLDEAMVHCEAAIQLDPQFAGVQNCIGNVLKDSARLDAAVEAFRKAVALDPAAEGYNSNLVMMLNYVPSLDPQSIAEEHRAWDHAHAEPLRGLIRPHLNDRDPNRRIRIGYVSPDFREHVVCRFSLPLIAGHDHERFEIFCYADVARPDAMTQRVRDAADVWRDITHLKEDKIAEIIREDRIDILVDLAGHTGANRLKVFALKPAPIQVTYLGYPATTGMKAMDYRITDAWADPVGMTESQNSEELIRLPRPAWCYKPPVEEASVRETSPHAIRPVTFCCFNNLTKVNEPLMQVWSHILRQVPHSKLLLKSAALSNSSVRQRFESLASDVGTEADRLQLLGAVPYDQHLSLYDQVDLALDTFPYHGTTTTCEALWMGVPVITLAGRSHVSRVGVSLLTGVGTPELIAHDPADYVRIAVDLANDRPRLDELHSSLRSRLKQSPVMNGADLASHIETEYRNIWQQWCARKGQEQA